MYNTLAIIQYCHCITNGIILLIQQIAIRFVVYDNYIYYRGKYIFTFVSNAKIS